MASPLIRPGQKRLNGLGPWTKGPSLNLYINPVNGLVVVVGCIVGYLVYRRPVSGAGAQPPQPQRDLVGGTATALATILILAFLFGLGDGQNAQVDGGDPSPTPITQQPGSGVIDSVPSPAARADAKR